jgi:CRP-like cAMP-binding protein
MRDSLCNVPAMPVPTPAATSSLLRLLPAAFAATGFAVLAQAGRAGNWPVPLPALHEPLSNLLLSLAALAAALLLVQALGWLVWDRLVPRYSGLRLPRLLRQFVAVLVMVMAFIGVLAQVWGVALSAVLATTGVIGLVLGLALRRILTDFFSGIALNVEQPFRLDDFILLHTRQRREPIAGLVREITWRSTRILTPEDNLVSVPNSVVASAVVENLSYPSPVSEQEIDLVLDWALPQGVAEALLGAAVTEAWAQGAAAGDKPPKVRICRLDGRGVTWRITYLLDPRRKAKGPARHELLACVHRHLVLAGLRPVHDNTPERPSAWMGGAETPSAPATGTLPQFDTREARRRVFDTLTLLDSLAAEEREALAASMRLRALARGDAVVERGAEGRSMFAIAAGVVEVRVPDATGQSQRVAVMGAGASFGEMSLLTGEARSADVVAMTPLVLFEIDAEALQPLLRARPLLVDALSRAVAQHRQADDRLHQMTQPTSSPAPSRATAIAARIRMLFRLS